MDRIVVTGGPQAGKTTAMIALEEEFGESITLVPEAATCALKEAFPQPGKHLNWSEEWCRIFQSAILPMQKGMEETWELVANEQGTSALIMDRGMLDGGAYMPGGLETFISTFGLDLDEVYSRYDLVIHLETVAKSKPELFGKLGNQHRYEENPDEAISLDDALQSAWRGHPNWIFIPSEIGIEAVVGRTLTHIGELVDIEDEKKFLLPSLPEIDLGLGIPVKQGYLVAAGKVELRVRQIGEQRFIALKGEGGERRRQWERLIQPYVFNPLWGQTEGKRIFKTRYLIPHGEFTLELDKYHGPLEGLVTFECEFKRPGDKERFTLPGWAKDIAIDVSDDPRYKNQYLALYGLPETHPQLPY